MRDSRWTDPRYLRDEQYRAPDNLTARMALHERFSTAPQGWQRWVFDQVGLSAERRGLELGCGPGRLWIENADRLPPPLALTLADQSLGMVREAVRGLMAAAPATSLATSQLDAQALPFRLENGAALLGQVFPAVTLLLYDDALVITEAAPLLAYARSMYTVSGHDFAALEREIARRIAADGAIRIAKETGLFQAE